MLRDMGRMQFKTCSVSLGKSPQAQQQRIDIPVWHDSESKATVTGLTGDGLLIEAISPEGDTRFFYLWLSVSGDACDAACQTLGLPAPRVMSGVDCPNSAFG
jgi:hypothetical protein